MGVVYTETVVHMAPPAFEKEVPYQVAIISLDTGERVTARIEGPRVSIDERVVLVATRDGVPYFRKSE